MNEDRICSVDGCDRPVYGRGLCNMHWQRHKRHGTTESLTPMRGKPVEERFWRLVDKTDDCWLWKGTKYEGYGRFPFRSATWGAHRVAYTLVVGEIPEGLTLDHSCNTPSCVRPDHLEPMSLADNVMRGNGACVQNLNKVLCKHGHEFTRIKTTSRGSGTCRVCDTCQKLRDDQRAAAKRTAAKVA